jgi:hydrogenase-4 component B
MPWTGPAVLTGALTMASVPLLGLFASEWLTFQALLRLGRGGGVAPAIAGGLATTALGITAALAAYAFVAVIGLGLLGRPRTEGYRGAREVAVGMRAPVVALAGVCALVGLLPGLLLPSLTRLAPTAPDVGLEAGLAVPGGSFRTVGLALALAAIGGAVAVARGRRGARAVPVWNCGQDGAPELGWTAAAFSKPANLSFSLLLRPEREVSVTAPEGVVHGVRHTGGVPHLFDARLYAPVLRGAMAGALVARRLQSGYLRQYVASLVALVLVLLALVRVGVIG